MRPGEAIVGTVAGVRPGADGGSDMTHASGRIVVGLDGSPGGRAALAFALQDAARRAAAVEVVTAFDTAETLTSLCGTASFTAWSSATGIADAVETESSRTVAEVAAELAGRIAQLPPVTVTAVGDAPAHALIRIAAGADLLVVGRRGRGRFPSTVLGSVSMQCVLHAPCAVTVVRPVGVDQAAVADVLSATAQQ
jgi:nucleotide-binding universal stress UspA family protein